MLRLLHIILLLLTAACHMQAAPPAEDKRIALTFDDIPREPGAFLTPEERTGRLIAALDRAGVDQAAFFVTVGNLKKPYGAGGVERIERYVRAGHVIANHNFAHVHLTDAPAEAYLAGIDRAEAWLARRPGRRPWFRFPYLNEGRGDKTKRDALRAGLSARGLRNAYATVDGSDWRLESLTSEAVAAGKPVNRDGLRDMYVEGHVEAAEFYDELARRTIGRSPAHVLLLHETDVSALFIGDLVAALRRAGWRIISADEAFADPIFKEAPDVPSAQGTLIEMLAWEKSWLARPWYTGNAVRRAEKIFAKRVLADPH